MTRRWKHLPPQSSSLQTNRECNGHTQTHTCTHFKEQPSMHKPPASIFHYYNAISWRRGWAVLRLYSGCECVRWAVIDTWPQTRVCTKKYKKGSAGSHKQREQRGKEQWVVQCTGNAGTQLCPSQADKHKYTRMLTQTRTKHKNSLQHWVCFVSFGCNLASTRQHLWNIGGSGACCVMRSGDQIILCHVLCNVCSYVILSLYLHKEVLKSWDGYCNMSCNFLYIGYVHVGVTCYCQIWFW